MKQAYTYPVGPGGENLRPDLELLPAVAAVGGEIPEDGTATPPPQRKNSRHASGPPRTRPSR
jgi:hypothetical protein